MQTIDPRNRTVPILGINVHDVTMTETLDWAQSAIADNRPVRIATPNSEIVRLAWKDPELKNLLNASDLAIPDGAGLLLAARFYGRRFREQVTGTDLAIELAGLCARRGWRMFLLGAGPGVAQGAADKLRARWPDIQIAGTYGGTADTSGDQKAQSILDQARPIHVLLVAYGAWKQEWWMERNQAASGAIVAIGVGGALDFIAGRVPRAPRWLRRAGFDWAFRLLMQPWRWRRQLALPQFVALAAMDAIASRFR